MDNILRRLWLSALVSLILLSGCVLHLHFRVDLPGKDLEVTEPTTQPASEREDSWGFLND